MPTKSGILGLLAAAQGRRRTDELEDLLELELAVRTEQQGTLLRDFHTAHHQVKGTPMPLTDRFYLSDAVFTAHIGGPRPLLEGLEEALRDPSYPLYLGRRSCVPEGRLPLGIVDVSVAESVRSCTWQPGFRARSDAKQQKLESVRLSVQADISVYANSDAAEGATVAKELNDVPLSFDPERRAYRTRLVVETWVAVPTGVDVIAPTAAPHDPMAALGGVS